jgi:hypothetical protein
MHRSALFLKNRVLTDRDHIHYATTASATKFHGSRSEGEEGVIFASAHIGSGVEVSAALANQDLTAIDYLTAETLDSQILGIRVATISCR